MPKMYKPNRITMSPNNETIDPGMSNNFSFIFNGEALSEYNLTMYDLFTGQDILTSNTILATEAHNGDVISKTLSSSFFSSYPNLQMSWDINAYGRAYTLRSTATLDVVRIPYANYGFAEKVFIYSAAPLGEQLVYLVPANALDEYYAFMTIEAARNGFVVDRIVGIATTTATVKANVLSEQVPFRTASTPTLILASMTATSAMIDTIPTYTHPNGYALNRFTVYLYDSSDNLLWQTQEIFSSYAHYQFDNLANGDFYKVRFTGYSVLEQFVDTGKIPLTVTYTYIPTTQIFSVTATNDCANGRMNIAIGVNPALMPVVYEGVITQFGVTNILIYRQEFGVANKEVIAKIPAASIVYHDYMAQSSKQYRYSIGFYGYVLTPSSPPYWETNTHLVVPNSVITSYITSYYYGWFLVDLDNDKSYAFDAQFEGGEITQEDDFTKYKTNLSYSSYSVGNIQALSSNNTGLISLSNLNSDFYQTNSLLTEIANLVSTKNISRKIVKDRRTPTRIYPVFTYGFKEAPLNNGISQQPYLCSFSWDQTNDKIE